ncbi:hypothetical protein GCM10027578_42700 [Spirosoma luteolum]
MKYRIHCRALLLIAGLVSIAGLYAQTPGAPPASLTYTAWLTGDSADVQPRPLGGVLLGGGSTDVREAMQWLLQRAAGGDVVILRASGRDGYNDYLFRELGVPVNSVETLLIDRRELASHPEVVAKVRRAEAIFLAGGDQGNYTRFWRDTPLSAAINERIRAGAVVGGTSAGCAILGNPYFSARQGTIRSEEALADPYDARMDVQTAPFIIQPLLAGVLTDMHYNNPDRSGRHLAFLARALADGQQQVRGIGIDEKTAVCVAPDGQTRVFGRGTAWFMHPAGPPEQCWPGKPLRWHRGGKAVAVLAVTGSSTGMAGPRLGSSDFDGMETTTYWSVVDGQVIKP